MNDRYPSPPPSDSLPVHRLAVPDAARAPVAVGSFDSIGPLSRAEFPHRHTFYEIVLVTGGSGHHVIDFTAHRIDPPQLGIIAPGHVHHWRPTSRLDGMVLLFDEALLSTGDGGGPRFVRLPPATADHLGHVLSHMEDEYRSRPDGFLAVIRSYLRVLLTVARRGESPPGPNGRVADAFALLVARNRDEWPSIDWYARHLGVSTAHLHERVKHATGLTPGQLIRRARAAEARRLLGGTDLTVRQIAARLGFADPAYFCRFFRRESGTTPGDYRDRLAL
ncbi:helix-turn-helix domain-containing protein [Stackebrandtia soli]|uniref:helix-turn-helix domain-containing protein n=1 Tax=Stackebrandtia soli TaxID=1892856 RepID=UPI0039EC2CE5